MFVNFLFQVSKNEEESDLPGDALPPKIVISVKANEMMNITITKTLLQLTNELLTVVSFKVKGEFVFLIYRSLSKQRTN